MSGSANVKVRCVQIVANLYTAHIVHFNWQPLMGCILLALFFRSGSVDDIIDHYKKEQIVEGYNLKEPVSVQVGTLHFY